jgi:tetratricopeptide (TPR) repeat protein
MNDYQQPLRLACGGLLAIFLLLRCAERKGRLRHLLSLGIMLAAAAVIYLGKDDKAVWIPALVTLLVPVALEVLKWQSAAGSAAPVASDSVGIEKFQKILEEQHRRFFLEEQKRQVVEAKLADIEKSWQEELELRKETQTHLAKLKGLLSDEQIRQAQAKVEQGDKEEAEKAFDAVADEAGRAAADAAFQSGKLAEDRLDYAKAMRQYRKAVTLEEDNPDYLRAAGQMACTVADYAHAQEWLERLLRIREEEEKDGLAFARAAHEVAAVYYFQSKYEQAAPLYKRSLEIKEKSLGKDHPDVAVSLNNLAGLYTEQHHYIEAAPLYKRSLEIWEQSLGKEHQYVAAALNNLAELHHAQRKYAEAEPLYKRSLEIKEKSLGKDHPDVAITLNNLAELYKSQRSYEEAEPLHNRALEIKEKLLGKDHPDVARSLKNLAGLYTEQRRYTEAEPLYKRSLEILEGKLGKDHPSVATTLNNLAGLYYKQEKYQESAEMFERAIAIMNNIFPGGHPNIDVMEGNYQYMKKKMQEQPQGAVPAE